MKVLLVLACILWLGADAYHTPEHNLRGPPFVPGRTHRYELELNMTAGVPGMSSQVAKSVIQMDVVIQSISDTEYYLKLEHVKLSEPENAAESPEAYVPLRRASELERDLSKITKFTYNDGEIKSYTLGESESLESRSIKRGILRHLEIKLEENRRDSTWRESEGSEYMPFTYNVTEKDEMGTYDVYYLVTVSPYPWFPYEKNVFNISKTMNYESYGYPSIHEHHNFASQGCPEVCRRDKITTHNRYGAGCPVGYEPHQTPLKASKNIHYNLRLIQGKMVFETIFVDEKNIAVMYDQDMVVNVQAKYELQEVTDRRIGEPQEQQEEYNELNTYPTEKELKKKHQGRTDDLADELSWIYGVYDNIRSSELVTHVERIWEKIAETVVAADTHGERGQEIGRDVVHMQHLMSLMKKSHYDVLWRKVVDLQGLKRAPEKEKVKRQILLDVIPLAGTGESVKFIKYLITEKKVSVWEAKEILEALPANLIEADEDQVKDIWELTSLPQTQRYHVLHSATYLTLANVIREACITPEVTCNEDDIDDYSSQYDKQERYESKRSKPSYHSRFNDNDDDEDQQKYESLTSKHSHRSQYRDNEDEDKERYESSRGRPSYRSRFYENDDKDDTPYGDDENQNDYKYKSKFFGRREYPSSQSESERCSKEIVERFIREITSKLKSASQMQEKIIYLQALSRVGHEKALKVLRPYAYGLASDTENYSPADIDYLQTVTLYALHNVATYYPTELLRLVGPIYFNRTESPRVRIAAFSASIRSQPTLSFLQHVARDSFDEPSFEVGSYVYSAILNYGNASLPCMKATADKIRLVVSQTKEYDIGYQYSKTVVQTFFDELRNFGMEYRSSVVQSNESAIPYTVFGSVGYNIESLRDVFVKFALNIQGLDVEDIFQTFDLEFLGLKMPRDIPSNAENEIFGTLNLLHRVPKEMRFAIYKKIFYADSFYFFDAESSKTYFIPLLEYLRDYFSIDRFSVSGHFVKVFIPSSFHSVSYSGISFPISTLVKHPLIISLKMKSQEEPRDSQRIVSHYIRPSVYYTTYYSHAIINTVDKHAYGVYHEQVYTASLPMVVTIAYDEQSNIFEVSYKLTEIPKKFYRHHSEAGTYVDELRWTNIGKYSEDRETINTIPTLFQHEKEYSVMGLPSVHVYTYTEDIQDQYDDIPESIEDFVELVVEKLRNPGWRFKDVNATIKSSRDGAVDKVTFKFGYNKNFVMKRHGYTSSDRSHFSQSDDDRSDRPQLNEEHRRFQRQHDDEDDNQSYSEDEPSKVHQIFSKIRDPSEHSLSPSDAEKVYEIVSKKLPKVAHELYFSVETSPSKYYAELNVEYNHTYDKATHVVMALAEVHTPDTRTPYKACVGHVMQFLNIPNGFRYNPRYYQISVAPFYKGISFGEECKPFSHPDIYATGGYSSVPYEQFFSRNEFYANPGHDAFTPDTHDECVKDVREGKAQSPACIAAIQDEAQYNRFYVKVTSQRDLPLFLQNVTYKVEDYLKHYYYSQVDINRVNVHNPPRTIEITANYIDKLTDTPVMDVFVKKPEEEIIFHKIDADYWEPVSSLYTVPETYTQYLTNNTYAPSCGLMEKYVRTYDMKVYPLPKDSCTYVLSTHCTERKKFAVLAKEDKSFNDAKEVIVYVADKKVILKPSESKRFYTIIYNNQPLEVRQPLYLDEEAQLHVYTVPVKDDKVDSILVLHADAAGIKIEYDGKNAKIEVNPLYKGKLCGLCSEFDGEITREYRGPNQCWYYDSKDFAHSSVVDGDKCGLPSNPESPALCPYGERNIVNNDYSSTYPSPYDSRDEDDDSYKRGPSGSSSEPKERTVFVQRREFVCFSTSPVPVCEEGYKPTEEYSVSVDFHCLPKYDATTRRLVEESKYRVLRELAAKKVDFSDSIKAASSCTSSY